MYSSQILLLVSLLTGLSAFTPSSYPAHSISQLVKENQRFAPLAMEDEDDDQVMSASEAPANDFIAVDDLDSEEDGSEDDGELAPWAVLQEALKETREKHRRHEKDTGSPEYQVAGMTERIRYLTNHLREHPKDYSTRRGLVALVNKRRRLLNYLAREDVNRYKEIISSLGIRHKAPGLVPSRQEIYARFPGQKAAKKHLLKRK